MYTNSKLTIYFQNVGVLCPPPPLLGCKSLLIVVCLLFCAPDMMFILGEMFNNTTDGVISTFAVYVYKY